MLDFFNLASIVFQMFPFFLLFTWLLDGLFHVHHLLTVFIDKHFN